MQKTQLGEQVQRSQVELKEKRAQIQSLKKEVLTLNDAIERISNEHEGQVKQMNASMELAQREFETASSKTQSESNKAIRQVSYDLLIVPDSLVISDFPSLEQPLIVIRLVQNSTSSHKPNQ